MRPHVVLEVVHCLEYNTTVLETAFKHDLSLEARQVKDPVDLVVGRIDAGHGPPLVIVLLVHQVANDLTQNKFL